MARDEQEIRFYESPEDVRSIAARRDFLASWDLGSADRTIKITRVRAADVPGNNARKGGIWAALFFSGPSGKEHSKPLKLNSTNAQAITRLHGVSGRDGKNWAGKLITIYATTCEVGGKTVDCIRVRPTTAKGGATEVPENVPVDEEKKAAIDAAFGREPGVD